MGKIHTVEFTIGPVEAGENYQLDLASQLTSQLQRMVRQCQKFRIKDIKIMGRQLSNNATVDDFQVAGQVRYLEPTFGRIKAIKNAFFAVQRNRKDQGITPSYEYDFRIGLDSGANYVETDGTQYGGSSPLPNQAVAYHNGTPYSLWCTNSDAVGTEIDYESVFRVYNFGIPDFDDSSETPAQVSGWNNEGQALSSEIDVKDYMQNETNLLVTNPFGPRAAHEQLESMPFSVANLESAVMLSNEAWSMDLKGNDYLNCLNGLLEVRIDSTEGTLTEGDDIAHLRVSVQVEGWDSYMK